MGHQSCNGRHGSVGRHVVQKGPRAHGQSPVHKANSGSIGTGILLCGARRALRLHPRQRELHRVLRQSEGGRPFLLLPGQRPRPLQLREADGSLPVDGVAGHPLPLDIGLDIGVVDVPCLGPHGLVLPLGLVISGDFLLQAPLHGEGARLPVPDHGEAVFP